MFGSRGGAADETAAPGTLQAAAPSSVQNSE